MAPLRYKVPLPGFAGVLVSVAGYDLDRRATITDLVRKLGGSVLTSTDKKSSCAITHLIIPRWGPDPPQTAAAAAAADNTVKLSERCGLGGLGPLYRLVECLQGQGGAAAVQACAAVCSEGLVASLLHCYKWPDGHLSCCSSG